MIKSKTKKYTLYLHSLTCDSSHLSILPYNPQSPPSLSPFSTVEPPLASLLLDLDLDLDLSRSAFSFKVDEDLDFDPLAFFESLSLLLSRLADLLDLLEDLLESLADFDLDLDLDP